MPKAVDNSTSVKVADSRLIRAMPAIAKYVTANKDSIEKTQLEFYSKMLPGALERHFATDTSATSQDPTLYAAVSLLAASFSLQTAPVAESEPKPNSNTDLATEEATGGASGPNNPEGVRTDRTALASDLSPIESTDNGQESLGSVDEATRPDVGVSAMTLGQAESGTVDDGRSRVTPAKGISWRRRISGQLAKT